MHLTPAGFPLGIPGIALEIEGAMQHAPHSVLHFIFYLLLVDNRLAARHTRNRATNRRGDAAGGAVWAAGNVLI